LSRKPASLDHTADSALPDQYACSFEAVTQSLGKHFRLKPAGIRQANKEKRPAQIMAAAFEEFTQKGYAAARLEDIAKRARISKALIYVYYPAKIDLFYAMATAFIAPMLQKRLEFAVDPDRSAEDQLREQHNFFYERLVNDPQSIEFFRLIVAECGRVPEIADFYTKNFVGVKKTYVYDLIRHGIARGEFHPHAHHHLEGVEDILSAPAIMMFVTRMVTGNPDIYELAKWRKTHMTMVLALLRTPPDAGGGS
jgi:AcrR family transcriptional regulator